MTAVIFCLSDIILVVFNVIRPRHSESLPVCLLVKFISLLTRSMYQVPAKVSGFNKFCTGQP